MFSKIFWMDAGERAIKTFAQAALMLLTMDGVNILTVDWKALLTASTTASVISVLTSIVSSSVRNRDTASLTVSPPTAPKRD